MKEYSQNAQVVGIQFGVLSPEDVKAMSVVPIEHEESFEAGAIRRGGLLDLRYDVPVRVLMTTEWDHWIHVPSVNHVNHPWQLVPVISDMWILPEIRYIMLDLWIM